MNRTELGHEITDSVVSVFSSRITTLTFPKELPDMGLRSLSIDMFMYLVENSANQPGQNSAQVTKFQNDALTQYMSFDHLNKVSAGGGLTVTEAKSLVKGLSGNIMSLVSDDKLKNALGRLYAAIDTPEMSFQKKVNPISDQSVVLPQMRFA
ncbi:hypothetical protein [Alteromonas antoniana]|uniref:hypothetical protein n=1 Tax=Alteromonas antoniana TaxID=2803813 RepID=UPI001C43EC5E|nr:hypothetical protein [Alteromonas antoniana]